MLESSGTASFRGRQNVFAIGPGGSLGGRWSYALGGKNAVEELLVFAVYGPQDLARARIEERCRAVVRQYDPESFYKLRGTVHAE